MTTTVKDIEDKLNRLTRELEQHQKAMDQIDDGHELFLMLEQQLKLQNQINQCHVDHAQLATKEIDKFVAARSRF